MSNFFEQALSNADKLEQELLGPDYAYYKQIKNPSQLGMSSSGDAIVTNLKGLIGYTELLVTGEGKASIPGGPLGDKFFLRTGATCTDKDTKEKVSRSLYFNNVPDGSIPFISQGMGMNFSTFKGLIPGALSNMNQLNPMGIFSAFMQGTDPECQKITMPTRDVNNVSSTQTAYMTSGDIRSIPACWFPDNRNPLTGATCVEGFGTITGDEVERNDEHDCDVLEQAFLASFGLLTFYILMKAITRK